MPSPSTPLQRAARAAGLLSPVVALGAILLATIVAPRFSWTGNALSDLGVTAGTALLFNAGLILAALLALPFVGTLFRATDGVARSQAVTFCCAVLGLGGVGLFPAGTPLHFPAALGFYLFATVTMVIHGVANRGETNGRLSLAAGGLHALTWWAWLAGLRPGPGLALPEFVGATLFAAWVWFLSPGRVEV